MAAHVLIPTVLPPLSAAEEAIQRGRVRAEATARARRLAYLQAVTPGAPRTISGAIPTQGAWEMPASELERAHDDSKAADRAGSRSAQQRASDHQVPLRWTLGPVAPAWLRRTWKKGSREVPRRFGSLPEQSDGRQNGRAR